MAEEMEFVPVSAAEIGLVDSESHYTCTLIPWDPHTGDKPLLILKLKSGNAEFCFGLPLYAAGKIADTLLDYGSGRPPLPKARERGSRGPVRR